MARKKREAPPAEIVQDVAEVLESVAAPGELVADVTPEPEPEIEPDKKYLVAPGHCLAARGRLITESQPVSVALFRGQSATMARFIASGHIIEA
jgi:hypothetical protein